MAMSKETQDWLDGLERDGGMSGAAVLELRQHLSLAKADEYVKGSMLRQSDYSRQMAEVQRLRAEAEQAHATLDAKDQATQKWAAELGQWQVGAKDNYDKALVEREKAEGIAARAVARLKSSATRLGLSEEDVLKDLEVAQPNQTPPQTPVDTTKFVTIENLQETARQSAVLEGILADIGTEHYELFGTRIKLTPLVQEAIAAGKGVEQYWRDKYNTAGRAKDLETANWQKKIDEAVSAKEAELRSQLPGSVLPRGVDRDNPLTTHKIFTNKHLMDANAKSAAEEGSGTSSGVSAAVAAFNVGKFHSKFGG